MQTLKKKTKNEENSKEQKNIGSEENSSKEKIMIKNSEQNQIKKELWFAS